MMTFYLSCPRSKLFRPIYYLRLRGISSNKAHGEILEPDDLEKCYLTLEVPRNADQETVRTAFLSLVKRYHPDSGCADADVDKFNAIETAYRRLQDKFAKERWGVDDGSGEYGLVYQEKKEAKQFDIKHTAPQHRQYLSHSGFGVGNQRERQKQHDRQRASNAVESVRKHRVDRMTATHESEVVRVRDRDRVDNIKTSSELERLVEDLIQESMSRGDFDNLSGSGKPLSSHRHDNPYVDFVTHKMNQVLIDNGFTPKWISLQKELREEISALRRQLLKLRSQFSENPLGGEEYRSWLTEVDRFTDTVADINHKIDRFNLLVPLLVKQMTQMRLDREAARALREGSGRQPGAEGAGEMKQEVRSREGLFGFIESVLLRR